MSNVLRTLNCNYEFFFIRNLESIQYTRITVPTLVCEVFISKYIVGNIE